MEVTRADKPWGYELLWAHTSQYAGKILCVQKGHSLSLHFHRVKDETQHVLSGRVLLSLEGDGKMTTHELGPGESFRIPPGATHRLFALETSVVLEASTSELDDIVRVEDDYGRALDDVPNVVESR